MNDLSRVVKLAQMLEEHQATVQELKDKLKTAEKDLRRVEREDLPQLMKELGLTEIRLDDGSVVSVREEVDARITAATKDAAHQWLIENGFGGLIKTLVAIQFARGDHEKAAAAQSELAARYGDVTLEEKVHPRTLAAFVKEQVAAGTAVPFDLFNVYPYDKATIKRRT